jgi:hypothetical protein
MSAQPPQQPPVRNWRKNIDAAIAKQSQFYSDQAGRVVDHLYEEFLEKTRGSDAKWPVVISLMVSVPENGCRKIVLMDRSSIAYYSLELFAIVMEKLHAELDPQGVDIEMRFIDNSASTVGRPSFWEFTFTDVKKKKNQQEERQGFLQEPSRC